MAKIRVAFFVYSLGLGGSERFIANLASKVDPSKFETHIFTALGGGDQVQTIPPHVHHVAIGQARQSGYLPRLAKLLKSLNPDVLLATGGNNLGLVVMKTLIKGRWRIILRPGTSPKFYEGKNLWAMSYAFRHADKVLCQGDENALAWRDRLKLPSKQVIGIPNPVDVQKIQCLAKSGIKPVLNNGILNLVCVGSLYPVKGQDLLVEALWILKSLGLEAGLTLVGRESQSGYLEFLRDLAKRLGVDKQIVFVKEQPNPYPWLAWADIVVLPSRLEGFPNILLEAMVLGKPIVATACPTGPREIVSPEVGRLVLPENSRSLADGIKYVFENRNDFDVSRIQQKALQFSNHQLLPRFESLLEGESLCMK